MATYRGVQSSKRYTLGQQLGVGGEGIVYDLVGDSAHVAKIYKPDRFKTTADRNTLERKLKAMLSMNIKAIVDGTLRLAWPQDILYENGTMVGFIMPKLTAKYKIFDIYRSGKGSVREREYPNYTWKYSVQFAYNLAWVVNYLHQNGIVIGDLNQNNIAVDTKTSTVILIDCDSFDIRDPRTGEHFPCVVGLEEMLAPELQTVGKLSNGTFTKESDNFSLAIHIFRLLMDNNDPFGGVITTNASLSQIPGNRAIINGECAYVRNLPNKKVRDKSPTLDMMPKEVEDLFRKTFDYTAVTAMSKRTNRATAQEWVNTLLVLAKAEPNPALRSCATNKRHVYSVRNFSCPWCRLDKIVTPPPKPVPTTRSTQNNTPKSLPNPNYTPQSLPNPNYTPRSTQASTTRSTAYTPPKKVRRTATMLYLVMILFGIASGFLFGEQASGVLTDAFDIEFTPIFCTIAMSIIGVIGAVILAHLCEDKYTHANNAIPWLLLSLVVFAIPPLIVALLSLAAAAVMVVVGIVVGLIQIAVIIFCLCSCCNGS